MAGRRRKVVIVGSGRLGRLVAEEYSQQQRDVVVIDRDADALSRLAPGFSGQTVCGDAEDLRVLRQADIGPRTTLMALTRDDDLNFYVAVAGRAVLHAAESIARVADSEKEGVFRDLGVATVSASALAARKLSEDLS